MDELLNIRDPQLWSWAMNVALLGILWEALRHQRKETVPRKVFETEQKHHGAQHKETRDMLNAVQAGVHELANATTELLAIVRVSMKGER